MSDVTCARPSCANLVGKLSGRGRPRKFCDEHRRVDERRDRPSYYKPQGPLPDKKCVGCGEIFHPRSGRQRFCSKQCREQHGGPICYICGSGMARGSGMAKSGRSKHQHCFEHGTEATYNKRGCRCEACTAAATAKGKAYRERRAAEGRAVVYNRSTVDIECRVCGEVFSSRMDALSRGRGRYCSRRCVVFEQTGVDIGDPDWKSLGRFRVSDSFRAAIYRRDRFICWLCGEATEPDVDPSDGCYPSLDHVVPRSRGGADSAENLRCAHRLCNSIRGAREVGDAFLSGVFGVAV